MHPTDLTHHILAATPFDRPFTVAGGEEIKKQL